MPTVSVNRDAFLAAIGESGMSMCCRFKLHMPVAVLNYVQK